MCNTDIPCVVLLCGFCVTIRHGADVVWMVRNMLIDGVNVCMNIDKRSVWAKFSGVRPQNILMLLMFK